MLEKEFYQLSELADRWGCAVHDLLHLGIQDRAQICVNMYGMASGMSLTRMSDCQDSQLDTEPITDEEKQDAAVYEKWKSRTTHDMSNGIFEISHETLRFLEMPGGTPFELHEAFRFNSGWWDVEFEPPVTIGLENLCILNEEVARIDCEIFSQLSATDDGDEPSDILAEAFNTQLENLKDTYWDLAELLKIDSDVSKLVRIGNWTRMILLDRREDGESFLSEEDISLLQATGIGYVLDEQQANKEWQAASLNERWVAFGIHVFCRIVAGGTTTEEEPFYLFRLASEMAGVLSSGGIEQTRDNSVVDNARLAADVRHSMPGGSREKRRQIITAWASGKYSSRDICAEQECAALGMSFSTARKALRGTPEPL